MKSIGLNQWFIKHQKEYSCKRYKRITLFRRYWDSSNREYKWENQSTIDIDSDVIKCGKIVWKADTDQLNVWKMGNLTFDVRNEDGKWNPDDPDGYWNNYEPFLSMVRVEVGFIASDNTPYEIFAYQGLIPKDGIQLNNDKIAAKIKVISIDYLIDSVNAEDVSRHPIDPEKKYYNSDIFSINTIGKTGAGWSVNQWQNVIVRIIGGTGKGQERVISSNTADTITTVNNWATTPDATSDFEILGEDRGWGNGVIKDFTTIQPGVGIIKKVWLNDDRKYEGTHYTVSQLNEITLGGKITFELAPTGAQRVIIDYIYWYQNQSFKFLIEKILDIAGITNRLISDVTFPEAVGAAATVEFTQTTEAEWNAGILNQVNTSRFSGDVILNDDTSTYVLDQSNTSGTVPSPDNGQRILSPNEYAQSFVPTATMLIGRVVVQMRKTEVADIAGDGNVTFTIVNDSGGLPGGTNYGSGTISTAVVNLGGAGVWTTVTINLAGLSRVTSGNTYWIKITTNITSAHNDTYLRFFNDNPYASGWFTARNDPSSAWQTGSPWNQRDIYFIEYYHPYYASGSLMSQTEDCGVSLASFGSLVHSETLNGGTVTYYTRTQAADAGWPASFNEAEWDQIDPFGQITSSVQRYLRVAFKITRASVTITPYVHEFTAEYYVESYEPALANFTGLTGKQAIETIAELANYEMGFFTNYDSTTNMIWDTTFDWPIVGFPAGHTFVTGGNVNWAEVGGDLQFTDDGTSTPNYGYFSTNLGTGTSGNWTVETRCWKKIGDGYNGFGYRIYGGAFRTEIFITNQGYGRISYINEDDVVETKKFVVPSGDYVKILIERKRRVIKISVNEEIALVTYANVAYDSTNFILDYGYLYADEDDFEALIDYIKIKKDVVASDMFYLPKYYFKPKDDLVETDIELFTDKDYIRLFNFVNGWNRVYNYVTAEYGDYSYTANADTELDEPPSSEDTYGVRKLSISGGDFLRKEDTNVATGAARRYYNTYKLPRATMKLLCKYLFQIDLSDQVKVYCREPSKIGGFGDGRWGDEGMWGDGGIWITDVYDYWFLPGVDFKVIGLALDLENYRLELDLEEILT